MIVVDKLLPHPNNLKPTEKCIEETNTAFQMFLVKLYKFISQEKSWDKYQGYIIKGDIKILDYFPFIKNFKMNESRFWDFDLWKNEEGREIKGSISTITTIFLGYDKELNSKYYEDEEKHSSSFWKLCGINLNLDYDMDSIYYEEKGINIDELSDIEIIYDWS